MLAGWLVPGHLIRGHLTWCPRLWNSWERECLVPGTWQVSPGSRAAESRMSGHGGRHSRIVQRSPCGGSFSTCCAGSCVSVRRARPSVQRLQRGASVSVRPGPAPCSVLAVEPVQGPLNAPDWLAGQHADRAWPTRRRGIRMPWWCWPVGRSPCCSPRQWPPGNESPCLIPRQR